MLRIDPVAALVVLVPLVAACDSAPPVKTASGEHIASVNVEESFPLSSDTHDTSFRGDRLRRAVALMDKAGIFGISGSFAATGVMNKSTLTLTVKSTDGRERVIVAKNCAETHVCQFFTDAVREGVAEKMPAVCRDPIPCASK